MIRREFIALLGGSAAWPLVARAQRIPIVAVGFLSSLSAGALAGPVAAFRNGLQSAGYEEGKNVTIEFRWADGHYHRLAALAADLVRNQVAIIVTVGGDPPAFAAKAATTTIPIVFMVGRDPVELGLVTSLSHPEGNATGINLLITEIESKRMELLAELSPKGSRFAVLVNPKNANAEVQVRAVRSAADVLRKQIATIHVTDELDLEKAFATHYTRED